MSTPLHDWLRRLIAALPSEESSVTLSRCDLETLLHLGDDGGYPGDRSRRDLTIPEVADEVGRAPSTVRGWLVSGKLRGYKLNGRDWRVPPGALRVYLDRQPRNERTAVQAGGEDLSAWRKFRSWDP